MVAGEEDEGVVEEVLFAERSHDLAYAPVDLLNGVTKVAEARLAAKAG